MGARDIPPHKEVSIGDSSGDGKGWPGFSPVSKEVGERPEPKFTVCFPFVWKVGNGFSEGSGMS